MNLINWLRNLEQEFHGQQSRRLRRSACGFSTIAAEVQTLESRQLLSAAGTAVHAPTLNPGTAADLHSRLASASGSVTASATTSDNWSGYVATNNATNSVTQVSASWTVPTAGRSAGNSYSCAWVGIDGWLGNTVEQIGTEQDMVNGSAVYYAWWEMWSDGVRQPQQIFASVSPGDSVSAQVQFISTGAHAGQFQLSFTDLTRPTSNFTTYQTSSATQSPVAPRSQAEWVVEATMEHGSISTLANFGTVAFSNALATIQGVSEPIGGPYSVSPAVAVYQINMVQQGVTVDTTSSLTTGQSGSSFTVSYLPQTPALVAPNLSATAQSSSSVSLAWNAVSGAQGYRVYEWNGSQAVLLKTLGSSTTTTQIAGLSAGTTYQFLVEVYNGNQTADSAWTSVTTQQAATAPVNPAVVLTGEYAVSAYGSSSPTLASIVQSGTQLTLNLNGVPTTGFVVNNASQVLAGNTVVATCANSAITFSSGTFAGQTWTKLDLPANYTNQSGAATQVIQNGTSLTFVDKFGNTSPGVWISPTQVSATAWGETATTGLGRLLWQDGSVWSENLVLSGTRNGSGAITISAAPSQVSVFDFLNTMGQPVHLVQTSTSNVIFIDATGHISLGTFLDAAKTKLTTPYFPNDVATISNDFSTLTWSDGFVWTKAATSSITVTDYTNQNGVPVHLIQNGTSQIAFVDGLGRTSLGTMLSPTTAQADHYPGDVATFSGNTVTWQDGFVWTQTNALPLMTTFTDTNGAVSHLQLTSSTTLIGLDGAAGGLTGTRHNGQIVWSNGAVWNNLDVNALNSLFEMGTGYP